MLSLKVKATNIGCESTWQFQEQYRETETVTPKQGLCGVGAALTVA